MKIEAPNDFVDMLLSLDKDMPPRCVVDALKWACNNPREASRVVEGYGKLKGGRWEFQRRLSMDYNPAEALNFAVDREARTHEELSLLKKVISKAKKEGYTFTLPNGVQCRIQGEKDDDYGFVFSVAGEEITLFYHRLTHFVIEGVKKYGLVRSWWLAGILYQGKLYDERTQTGKALIQAIEQNVHPNVAALICLTR